MEKSQLARRAAVALATLVWLLHSVGALRAGGWTEQRTSGPFVCRSDFSLQGYEVLFQHLEQLQRDLTHTLGVVEAKEPVELYLFSNKKVYADYLKAHYPDVPYRRALFVKGSGPGRVFVYRDPKNLEIDVRHESTHALLHAVLPVVPLWLDEGLAEFFEVPPDDRAFANPHLNKYKWMNVRLGSAPRLRQLEEKRDVSDMSETDYRCAWAWVHFMLYGPPEAHEELVHYLADIQAHVPPGRLSERLERRLPGVEKRLVDHFKSWKRP